MQNTHERFDIHEPRSCAVCSSDEREFIGWGVPSLGCACASYSHHTPAVLLIGCEQIKSSNAVCIYAYNWIMLKNKQQWSVYLYKDCAPQQWPFILYFVIRHTKIFVAITIILQIFIYTLFLPAKCITKKNYTRNLVQNLNVTVYTFIFMQRNMITADSLIGSADSISLTPLFCLYGSMEDSDNFFGNLEVVFINPEVVDISASPKKHTLVLQVSVKYKFCLS